ncbi:hypothetical protein L226DRAFT_568540 [Lentinus tigrinus ALCF2SS1-7]|uniref:Uncharacterized protein n=1 Tax=Lentinus tigrinus ALCF2SS1-6 TaxID=1328759 RepID=A0A5C2SHK3_9APHY|nr:hypothetical protein L227DRAFT_609318 [Lentinus tigrinus ALCF2SS1-6]RPD77471.1 hypothetical protein L226DRAFT_568540 [Lentinus tigrinus ALCF2SS1-7]
MADPNGTYYYPAESLSGRGGGATSVWQVDAQFQERVVANNERNALWLAYQEQQRQITEMKQCLDRLDVPQSIDGGNRALGAQLVAEIHDRMLRMMGCGHVKVKYTTHVDARAYHDLPDRPPDLTTARMENSDGKTLWIPDWDGAITSRINDEFTEGVVDVVLMNAANAGKPIDHLRKPIKNAAKKYLRTLKKERRQRLAGPPNQRVRSNDDREHRRANATRQMRKVETPLRKYLGYNNTVGLAAVVRTDFVNSEWSDRGEKDPQAREALRTTQNKDAHALEVRPVLWHVKQLDHIYAVLRGIRAAGLPSANKDPELAAIMDPVDDGVDFTDEQRKQFLTIVQSNVNVRRRRWNQYDRFWGRSDERMRERKQGELPAYRELISPSWAGASADNMRIYERAPACPSGFTILTTPMPRELMTWDDQVRYAPAPSVTV